MLHRHLSPSTPLLSPNRSFTDEITYLWRVGIIIHTTSNRSTKRALRTFTAGLALWNHAPTAHLPPPPHLYPPHNHKSFFHQQNHPTSRSHHSYDFKPFNEEDTHPLLMVEWSLYLHRYGWQDLNRFVLTSPGSLMEFTHPFCQPCRQSDCRLRHKDTKTRRLKFMISYLSEIIKNPII